MQQNVIGGALVSDRLRAMRDQEVTTYRCADYFLHVRVGRFNNQSPSGSSSSSTTTSSSSTKEDTLEKRREKVCEWIYQVVDQCDMDREIAEVALSFLDRFLSSILVENPPQSIAAASNPMGSNLSLGSNTESAASFTYQPPRSQQDQLRNKRQKIQPVSLPYQTASPGSVVCSDEEYSIYSTTSTSYANKSISTLPSVAASICIGGFAFQLAALTALYLAIKLYDHRRIRIDRLAYLSNGNFSTDDITSMERTMLSTLRWKCNPPTSIDFLRTFSVLLPKTHQGPGSDVCVNDDITELARFLVELCAWECNFISQAPSTLALAAIFIAMDVLGENRVPVTKRNQFVQKVESCVPGLFDFEGQQLTFVRHKLHEIFKQSAECVPGIHETFLSSQSTMNSVHHVSKEPRSAIPSPVCISQLPT